MITRNNLQDVIRTIDVRDQNRIRKSTKEYVVLILHTFNVGSYVQVILTDDYNRYKNVSSNGNCILSIDDPCFSYILTCSCCRFMEKQTFYPNEIEKTYCKVARMVVGNGGISNCTNWRLK